MRPMIRNARARASALTVAALALAALLSGCAPSGAGDESSTPPDELVVASTPTAVPSEAATPAPAADPLQAVTSLVMRPTALELRDASGAVVESLDYESAPADAIEVLTELLGAPPSDEPYRATNHTPAGVYHAWDDLVIDERFYDEAVRDGWRLRFAVYFDGPSVRGLDLASAQGFHADDAWTTLSGDPVVDSGLLSCEGTPVEAFDAVDESPRTVAVVARASDDGATIRWLSAPQSVMERLGCV